MAVTQNISVPAPDRHVVGDVVWIGSSAASSSVITAAIRAARLDSSLLLTGERGSGKRLLARMVHAYSTRRDAPFVDLDQTGTEDSVADCFERAGRGIVYVDRIDQRPPDVQKRLIHVMGSGPFLRPRLIASSCRDLRIEARAGRVSDRLLHLLGTQLEVPPLRKRATDIAKLASHFQSKGNGEAAGFSAEALQALERYDWPGNVRELRSVVESLRATGKPIELTELPSDITQRSRSLDPEAMTLSAMERQHIQRVLRLTGGRLTRAAELLGIHRNTLRRKLDQYGITGTDTE